MTNGNKSSSNIVEIVPAIALLGGVLTALLKINDYSNNNILPNDSRIFNVVYISVASLSIEVILIFLFLILKGISIFNSLNNDLI